ncbi:MAG: hypothetical protein LBC07_01130 [Elusimicrobiota bacterium]|nr:hypothetical protein [Elusimicrobiota bacterium]
MKKTILPILLTGLITANVFAAPVNILNLIKKGEINIKASYDFSSSFGDTPFSYNALWTGEVIEYYMPAPKQHSASQNNRETKPKTDNGFAIGAEYLYPVVQQFKAGVGMQYVLPRQTKTVNVDMLDNQPGVTDMYLNFSGRFKMSYLPVYLTLQYNIISGLYIKGNLGYNVYYDSGFEGGLNRDELNFTEKNTKGSYQAIIAGWEFRNNLVVEMGYEMYRSKTELSWDGQIASGVTEIFGEDELGQTTARGKYSVSDLRRIYIGIGYKISLNGGNRK